MAHELDTRENGTAAYVGRKSAWHELGTVIPDRNITFAEALTLGGADFSVELRDVYEKHLVNDQTAGPDDEPEHYFNPISGYKSTVRTDRDTVLGIVGSRYTPLQNRDAFGILEPLVDAGVARIETAGTLRNGQDVWLLVAFDLDDDEVKRTLSERPDGDVVRPYALISNNHAGRRQAIIQETPIRVVCANTLGAAFSAGGQRFKVRHTLNVEARVTEAAQVLFGDLTKRYRAIAQQYEQLRATHLDTALFRKLVLDVAAPIPEKLTKAELSPREETSREKVAEKRERLALLWENGDGHTGDHSAWEAYNGVTQSIDHEPELWGMGTGERRLRALFEGRADEIKSSVLESLVSYAATTAS